MVFELLHLIITEHPGCLTLKSVDGVEVADATPVGPTTEIFSLELNTTCQTHIENKVIPHRGGYLTQKRFTGLGPAGKVTLIFRRIVKKNHPIIENKVHTFMECHTFTMWKIRRYLYKI